MISPAVEYPAVEYADNGRFPLQHLKGDRDSTREARYPKPVANAFTESAAMRERFECQARGLDSLDVRVGNART